MLWNDPYTTICIRGVDVPKDILSINKVLEVPYISNDGYLDKAQEMDIRWIWDTLVAEGFRDKIY